MTTVIEILKDHITTLNTEVEMSEEKLQRRASDLALCTAAYMTDMMEEILRRRAECDWKKTVIMELSGIVQSTTNDTDQKKVEAIEALVDEMVLQACRFDTLNSTSLLVLEQHKQTQRQARQHLSCLKKIHGEIKIVWFSQYPQK